MLRYVEKSCFVKSFSLFSNKKFRQKAFLYWIVTRFWYFFSKSSEYFNENGYLLKCLFFVENFFFEKWRKNLTKQFFLTYQYKLGKFNYARWWVPCYFKKNLSIWYLKELFKKWWTKIWNFQMFQSFFYIKCFIFHEPHHLCL